VKRLTLIFPLVGILLLGFVFFYIRKIDPDELRRLLVYHVEHLVDANFEVGKLEFSGLKSFQLTNVGLFRQGEPILKIAQADVDLSLVALLQSRLEFSQVHVKGLDLFFTRNEIGWNFDHLWTDPDTRVRNRHRPFLSLGDEDGEKISIEALKVEDGTLYKEGLPKVSFQGSGSLDFPQLHLTHLSVGSNDSSIVVRLDLHLQDQAVNVWFNDSSFSLADLRDYLEVDHSLEGMVSLEGGVRWNRDEIAPQLRWRSRDLKWKDSQKVYDLPYLEGQWDESGVYSLIRVQTEKVQGNANLLIETPPEELFWQQQFSGKILIQKLHISGIDSTLAGELDFHSTQEALEIENFHLTSGPGDQLVLDGEYLKETGKLSFGIKGSFHDLENYHASVSGPLSLDGKGTFTTLGGLEMAVGGRSSGLALFHRTLPDLSFQLQSIQQDDSLQFPEFRVDFSRGGHAQFQGMVDLKKGFPEGLSGRLEGDHLDFSTLAPTQKIVGQGGLEILALRSSIQGSIISVHNLKGLAGEGEFSFRGTVDPTKDEMNMLQGKLRLVKMPMSWLNDWVPQNIRIEGVLDTLGPFQLGVESPNSTKLQLTGSLSSVGLSSMDGINVLGSIDLKDFRQPLSPSWEKLDGVLRVGISQLDANLIRGGLYSSQVTFPLQPGMEPLVTEDVEIEFHFHRNPSLGRIKKLFGKIFSGSYRLEGVSEFEGQKVNQFSLSLDSLDFNQMLGFLAPDFRDRASGILSGKVGFLSVVLPVENNQYPLVMDGFFGLDRPSYSAHPLLADIFFYVKRSAQSGILHQILEPGALGLLYEPPDLKFQDLERIPFTLSKDVLTLPELDLRGLNGGFHAVSLAPLVVQFPGRENPTGQVRGKFEISLSNAFLREAFPRLKEEFKEDLKETLLLEGPFKNPIPSAEIARVKHSLAQALIRNSLPRPSKLPAEVELARLEENLLSKAERQKLRVKSSEYLMKMLSPEGRGRIKDLVGGLVTRSVPVSVSQTYSEVVDIKNQIRNAREKLRSLLENRF
jgi:hypothetical protein